LQELVGAWQPGRISLPPNRGAPSLKLLFHRRDGDGNLARIDLRQTGHDGGTTSLLVRHRVCVEDEADSGTHSASRAA
jgi:hypothetical protein